MTAAQKKIINRLLTIAIAVTALLLVLVLLLRGCGGDSLPEDPPEEILPPAGDVSTQPDNSSETPPVTDPAAEASLTALQYSGGDTTLAFTRNENDVWSWDGDPEFPLDPAHIRQILAMLSPLDAVLPTEAPASAESCGLDEPAMFLTAAYSDGSQLHLEFGDRLPDSTDRWLFRSDKPDTFYVTGDTLPALMDTPIYDMMELPRLPIPELSAVSSITVRGSVETVLTAARQEIDGQTVTAWLDGERDVTALGRVQALLAALPGLKLARCENFKPSDGAITYWDLDAPEVTLEIAYGEGRLMTLTVGARTLSGDARYVQFNGDTTVYSMSETELAPLMTAAAFGVDVPTADETFSDAEEEPEI